MHAFTTRRRHAGIVVSTSTAALLPDTLPLCKVDEIALSFFVVVIHGRIYNSSITVSLCSKCRLGRKCEERLVFIIALHNDPYMWAHSGAVVQH